MKSRLAILLISLIIPFLLFSELHKSVRSADRALANQTTAVISDTLLASLHSSTDQPIRYIIHFKGDPNFAAARALPPAERRTVVVEALKRTAVSAQADTLNQLSSLQQQGLVENYRQLWIINAVSVVGSPETVAQLATHPAIERIDIDQMHDALPQNEFTSTLDSFFIEGFVQQRDPLTSTIKSWGLNNIRAPHVWHGLGVDGTGVTVGIIDSGVDYLHPDLVGNYRGNLGNGTFDHSANWFNAVITGSVVPTDTFGHGTHVAGTAVGQNGIGVAPNAEWIGVNVFTPFGTLFSSDGIAGLQWFLAPNGDPSLAPDVINGSWGNIYNTLEFHESVKALDAAGIIPIFAMGNGGPKEETIASPASYTETIGVGASDERDGLAWFSSRGPSPHTDQVHPHVLAPGAAVYSAFPEGRYAIQSGTSMATPHVAGLTALLLSVDSGLTQEQLKTTLAQTAVPISPTTPNNFTGWGIVDALTAVSQHVPHGELRGELRDADGMLPNQPFTLTTSSGAQLPFVTDDAGRFAMPLQAGSYELVVERFGYVAFSKANINVSNGQTTTQNVTLSALPSSQISGVVRDETGEPVPNVRVSLAARDDVAVWTDENGRYQLKLPAGFHKLAFEMTGLEIERRTVMSQPPNSETVDVSLAPIPKILLVDAGDWAYASVAPYYKDALDGLDYSFDLHQIRDPYAHVPQLDLMQQYDTVIWSDPYFSPGTIFAGRVITNYLDAGGNMLISGQNVGARDGVGYLDAWWRNDLQAQYLGKEVITVPLSASPDTPYSGLLVPIGGGNSANNQGAIDAAEPRKGSLGQPLLYYSNGQPAALGIGQCKPFRLAYFGFGLEGVSFSVSRSALLSRTFDYFDEPEELVGVRWLNSDVQDFALPGKTYTYTLAVQNISEAYTDTLSLSLNGMDWQTSIMTPTLTLGPCEAAQTLITLTVPDGEPDDSYHDMRLTAVSSLNPAHNQTLQFNHKTPGDILLMDDDRWYDAEESFKVSMNRMNLTYDVWDTNWKATRDNSPPADILAAFDLIIWSTGYDWFQPVTPNEREGLKRFLDQGGRLFLSSQDFMYYHAGTELARDYLGVIDYRESISPTAMFGAPNMGFSSKLSGPLPLTYGNYRNFSDGLIPAADGDVLLWHSSGMPAAVGHQGERHRAVLMAVPFETLPPETHDEVMNQMVGWIGDLGGSSIVADDRHIVQGEPRTYTITIRNTAVAATNQVTMTNPLPAELTLVAGTLTGGASYHYASRTIRWGGTMAPDSVHQVVYRAVPKVGLAAETTVENKATFAYSRHPIVFDSYATGWVGAPDLRQSHVTMTTNRPVVPDVVTFTLWLTNSGLHATNNISAVLYAPLRLNPLTETIRMGDGTAVFTNSQLIWTGDLAPNQSVTASMAFTRSVSAIPQQLNTIFFVEDGITAGIMHRVEELIQPYMRFFPFAAKD